MYNSSVYSLINGTLYRFSEAHVTDSNTIYWSLLQTIPDLEGLINYGMEFTKGGILVLFGGQREVGEACALNQRVLSIRTGLWLMDTKIQNPKLVQWGWVNFGGYSKVIQLKEEILCVFSSFLETKVLILDLNLYESYEVQLKVPSSITTRQGYSVINNGPFSYLIYGGFNLINGSPVDVESDQIVLQLIFSDTPQPDTLAFDSVTVMIISLSILAVVLLVIFSFAVVKIIQRKKSRQLAVLTETSLNSIQDISHRYSDAPTLHDNTYNGLYIPAFLEMNYGSDFSKGTIIASGGLGDVWLGTILKNDVAQMYNNGDTTCVVKIPKKKIRDDMFSQELSIHEVFRDNKYFSKLICYSQNPQCIVLKYYILGSLKKFIHNPKDEICKYSVELAISLALKMAYALNLMHLKDFVHNDIKPDNILLDKDEKEPLFPVLSDFGIVHIMNSAIVIKGMNTVNVNGVTLHYAAPERLQAANYKRPVPSTKPSDVYSFGIVLLEILSRKSPWQGSFNREEVIKGMRPVINWNYPRENPVVKTNLIKLIKWCFEKDFDMRPTIQQVYDNLVNPKQMNFDNNTEIV